MKDSTYYLNAIEDGLCGVHDVPENLLTTEICELAVKYGASLFGIPKNLMTPKMVETAVHRRGSCIQDVPEHLLTPDLVLMSVYCDPCTGTNYGADGSNIMHIPEKYQTKELIELATRDNLQNWDCVKNPDPDDLVLAILNGYVRGAGCWPLDPD